MNRRIQLQTHSQQETQNLAAAIARRLSPGDFIAIEGELGAGKTVFVRGLADGLGIDASSVSSPTFVIRHEYVDDAGVTALIHIDAYRLVGPNDLETIGWSELRQHEKAIVAVEWPSRIRNELPTDRLDVTIDHAGMNTRTINIECPEALNDRLQDLSGKEQKSVAPNSQRCRRCGEPVDAGVSSYPFCSSRCKLSDLGKWFREGYRVSRPMEHDDADQNEM